MMDHGMYGISAAQQPQGSSEEDDLWITNTDNIHKETSAGKTWDSRSKRGILWLQVSEKVETNRCLIHSLVGIQSYSQMMIGVL